MKEIIKLLVEFFDTSSNSKEKLALQNLMYKSKIFETLSPISIEKKVCHSKLRKWVFTLWTRLLDGGYIALQNEFYYYFINNPDASNFFFRTFNYLSEEIHFLNREKSLHEKIDYIIKDIKHSYKIYDSLTNVDNLRTIQLLAENHNSNLQVKHFLNKIYFIMINSKILNSFFFFFI